MAKQKNTGPKAKSSKATAKLVRGLSRKRIVRLGKLRDLLTSGKPFNRPQLAQFFEVSEKIIERDVAELSKDLPIEFNFKKNCYEFTEPVAKAKGIAVTRTELIATIFMTELGQELKGTCWEQAIESLCERVADAYPDYVTFRPGDWSRVISVRKKAETRVGPQNLELMVNAIGDCEVLHVTYMNGDGQESERDIDPLHLYRYEDNLYLIAYDHKRGKILPFTAWRLKPIQRTGRKFVVPGGFTPAGYFKYSLGIHGPEGDKIWDVVIRFRKQVALKIIERRWNALHDIKRLEDGSVETHFKLHGLLEVSRLILAWAPDVISISPPELLQMHACNLQIMNANLAKMMAQNNGASNAV